MAGGKVSLFLPASLLLLSSPHPPSSAEPARKASGAIFQTSDRCLACHNGITTPSGEDVSIGFNWRPSIMANSSRDPYWQASVRREITDHPESRAHIEDECSSCHMPMARYEAKQKGREGEVFAHLPFNADDSAGRLAADGVSCSLCHQIGKDKLGTPESFTGGFVIDPPDAQGERPEYGPYKIEAGQSRIMRSSSGGFRPTEAEHIQKSEVCATCHTLYTKALAPDGKVIGRLPEQVPYQEWLHSDFRKTQSCQSCHMPVVKERVPITKVLGVPREEVSRHVFVGGNFFMLADAQPLSRRVKGGGSIAGTRRGGRADDCALAIADRADRRRQGRACAQAVWRWRSPSRTWPATSYPPPIPRAGHGCTSSSAIATSGTIFESGAVRSRRIDSGQ